MFEARTERLGDPATWQYSAEGGLTEFDEASSEVTPTQNKTFDAITQARFLGCTTVIAPPSGSLA